MFDENFYQNYPWIIDSILIFRSLTKILIDIYMSKQFIRSFFFFVDKKRQKFKLSVLTCFNKTIIFITMFLWAINALNTLSVVIVWSFY